jgi:hypothetical protein
MAYLQVAQPLRDLGPPLLVLFALGNSITQVVDVGRQNLACSSFRPATMRQC